MPPSPPLRAAPIAAGVGALALLYRGVLTRIYWGHEEEDWGNLQMIRGILEDPFGQIETEHMPLFTWLAAVFSGLLGDPQLGAEALAALCGAGTVAVTTWIGVRWFSPLVGLLAGLLLCFQPESALYSASPLRESLYTLLMMGGVALIGSRRLLAGAVVLSIAFLARFNIAFSILPALALWVFHRRDATADQRRGLVALAVVSATVVAWAAYYHHEQGTWAFWGGVMDRNTGNAVTDLFVGERFKASFGAALGLIFIVLPGHIGWAVVPLAVLGLLKRRSASLRDEAAAAWLGLCGLATVALLLLTAVVSTYEWWHNLYWKWLTPTVPYFCLFAVHGGRILIEAIVEHPLVARGSFLAKVPASVVRIGAAAVLLAVTAQGYVVETSRQVEVSSSEYGTQVRVARWFEEAWPPDAGVLTWAYSIPAAYLQRVPSERRIFSWDDPQLPTDSPAALGAWLAEQRIGLVIWYSEEGTGAREAAAYLESAEEQVLGPVQLRPLVDERSYGTIAYLVVGDGIVTPTTVPSRASLEGSAP